MKRIITLFLILMLTVCMFPAQLYASANEINNEASLYPVQNKPAFVGDINFDYDISSLDSLIVLRAGVNLEPLSEMQSKVADVNNDGKINSADSLSVLRYSVGLKDNNYIGTNIILSPNSSSCRILKKVVCCGDSYTAGFIVDPDGVKHSTNEAYAWPQYMSDITGNNWCNCGASGSTVLTWQNASRGLPRAKTFGKAQAYVIGLGINDVAHVERSVPLGTINDIGTNAQTYYGGMSKIIRELNAISPKAKIFVNTCPRTGEVRGKAYADYNQAIRDIVAVYKDKYPVHCIDLENYIDMYNTPVLQKGNSESDYKSGHYTAIGYELFAENYEIILSNYINTHIKDFQDVPFIEYD